MSDELPSAWGQTCPRSVRLAPNGLLVPASTLRALLRLGSAQELLYTGCALEPSIRDGETVRVSSARDPRRGDLLLCDVDGWGDLLRALGRSGDGSWKVSLDAFPSRWTTLPADRVLAVAEPHRGGLARFLAAARLFPLRRPAASFRLAWQRVLRAPEFADGASAEASVLEKYRQQVAGYRSLMRSTLSEDHLQLLSLRLPPAGTILVCGSGAGSEAIDLARRGYAVAAFDAVPEMVRVARKAATTAGVRVEFLLATLSTLDLGERRFDAVYLTPMLYSFVAGRARRIAALQRLAGHMTHGGGLLLSARTDQGLAARLQTTLAAMRRRRGGSSVVEEGDWYTWYLTPRGDLGYSYVHNFTRGAIESEIRAAGLRVEVRRGGQVLATRP